MDNFKIHIIGENQLAELIAEERVINNVDDALDLIGNADYKGCRHIVVKAEHLHPDFFELKTGLAGEILQKFSTYQMMLAIAGDFTEVTSKSLRDFIYESNKVKKIIFVNNVSEAILVFSS